MNSKTVRRFFKLFQFATLLGVLGVVVADGARAVAQSALTPEKKYSFNFENVDLRPVITSLALSKDKSTIYVGGDNQRVYSCDVNDSTFELALSHSARSRANNAEGKDWIRALAFSPARDSNLLATLSQDGQVTFWNVDSREAVMQTELQTTEEIKGAHSVAFLAGGRMIAVSAYKSYVNIYDCDNRLQLYAVWDAPGVNTTELVASPNGRLLAMGGRSGKMRICQTKTPTQYAEFTLTSNNAQQPRRIRAIAFSPSGKLVAVGGDANQIAVCEVGVSSDGAVSIGRQVASLSVESGKVYSLTFCGEDELAAGYSTNFVKVWDLSSQSVALTSSTEHKGTVSTMYYDEEAEALYTGSYDTTVIRWFVPKKTR